MRSYLLLRTDEPEGAAGGRGQHPARSARRRRHPLGQPRGVQAARAAVRRGAGAAAGAAAQGLRHPRGRLERRSARGATSAASRSWRSELGDEPLTLVYAAGSGGTGAGLILGIKLLEAALARRRHQRVRRQGRTSSTPSARSSRRRSRSGSCRSSSTAARSRSSTATSASATPSRAPRSCRPSATWRAPKGSSSIPVYTGKAFHGLHAGAGARSAPRFGERICFIHTGGIYGLFPKAKRAEPLL